MSQPRKFTLIGVMLGASILAFGLLALTGKSSGAIGKSDQYCWGQMAPRTEDSGIGPILSEACFEDEQEAQQFGAADAVYTHFTIYPMPISAEAGTSSGPTRAVGVSGSTGTST